MQQINIELFRECCALTFTIRRWSNRKTVRQAADYDGVKASRVRKTIRLTTSKEYQEIVDFQNKTKGWVIDRSMPSFFKTGVYMVKISEMTPINAKLVEDSKTLQEVLVPKLVKGIVDNETVDRQELGSLYKIEDYPLEGMDARFGFSWLPISFGVPENLPKQLFEESRKKSEEIWKNAQEKILVALRMAFAGLIDHAVERLKVSPGDKPKIFKASTIDNIKQFLETFESKNLLNDVELAKFVEKAEAVLMQVDENQDFSELMRSDEGWRERVASQFEDIKDGVSNMIISRPSRVFNLDVDED